MLNWDKEKLREDSTRFDNKYPVIGFANRLATEKNLLIEGDNLEILVALSAYIECGQMKPVDNILIDPPYNTKKAFTYQDKFNIDDWIDMMHRRLLLAYDVLAEHGTIMIHIDHHSYSHLKLLCDEIFGVENLIDTIVWVGLPGGRSTDKHISNTNEFILVYAKDIDKVHFNKQAIKDAKEIAKYEFEDEISRYKKAQALYNGHREFNVENRPNLCYAIYVNEETGEIVGKDEKYFDTIEFRMVLPKHNTMGDGWIKCVPPTRVENGKEVLGVWTWGMDKLARESHNLMFTNKKVPMLFIKDRLSDDGVRYKTYTNIIDDIPASAGTIELFDIFGKKVFDHPKPVEIAKRLLRMCTKKDAVVLDFFAGSGTTGQAVLELNKEDNGTRKFILGTNNQNNICQEVTLIRLARVLKGYTGYKSKKVYEGYDDKLEYNICMMRDVIDNDSYFGEDEYQTATLRAIQEQSFGRETDVYSIPTEAEWDYDDEDYDDEDYDDEDYDDEDDDEIEVEDGSDYYDDTKEDRLNDLYR